MGKERLAIALFLGGVALVPHVSAQPTIDHSLWGQVLKRHVREGLVDYEALTADPTMLDRYLMLLKTTEASQLPSREAQLAFWINAYNACVIKGVLGHYPLKSVKDVKGFFDRLRYHVSGQSLTLDEIEGRGRALGDWRIHFALVCASSSCPPLRAEAYRPEQLEAQLTEQTRQFLADPRRGVRLEGSTLGLSQIFKWYADDFVPAPPRGARGARGARRRLTPQNLLPVIRPHLDPEVAQAIQTQPAVIKFLDYDWTVNDTRPLR